MTETIFYSWQSDRPNKLCRAFIEKALEQAIKELHAELKVVEPERPGLELDKDTKGSPGSPPITDTILKKIDAAKVFVADLSFCAERADGRCSPNPNVLIEYGYALHAHGTDRIISVMNAAYGKPPEQELPFNLKHLRNPINYHLDENSTDPEKNDTKNKLIRILKTAIQDILKIPAYESEQTHSVFESRPMVSPGRFALADDALGISESLLGSSQEIRLIEGPVIWLRVAPQKKQTDKFKVSTLRGAGTNNFFLMPLNSNFSGCDYFRSSEGWGTYPVWKDDVPVPSISFAFRDGEVWGIDAYRLRSTMSIEAIALNRQELANSLTNYAGFLSRLGIDGALAWQAGIHGVSGRSLLYAENPTGLALGRRGGICTSDTIVAEGSYTKGENAVAALTPFFEEVFDACGMEYNPG